jgi:hypothetical protein
MNKSNIWLLIACLTAFFASVEPIFAREAFKDFFVKVRGAARLRDGLNLLPQEYRQNYTLMRESLSLHSASELAPRVISFGQTGETIYTFNGNPDQAAFQSIEVADFDSKLNRLHYHEVIFKSESELPESLKTSSRLTSKQIEEYFFLSRGEVAFQNRNVIISKPNPAKCMACHSADVDIDGNKFQVAKYIWGPYRGWKGAYGEFQDAVGANSDGKDPQQLLESFLQFKNDVRPNHPRYSWLDPGTTQAAPYSAYASPGSQDKVHAISSEPNRFSTSPNLRLTFMIASNYARMISDIFFKSRKFQADPVGNLRQMFCENQSLHEHFDFFLDIGPLTEYREQTLELEHYWASQDDIVFFESDLEKLVRTHVAYLSQKLVPGIALPPFPVAETLMEKNMKGADRETVRFLTEVGKLDMRFNHPLKTKSPSPKDLVENLCKSLPGKER